MKSLEKTPRRLRIARIPTPIEPLPRLSAEIGGPTLLMKRDDLTGMLLSGNKVRKLEFCLGEAKTLRADTIVTVGGVQSNHCRATAVCCARLGLHCHLVLRGSHAGAPDGNLLLDHLAGARVTHLDAEHYSTRRPEIIAGIMEEHQRAGRVPYYIPVGASNATGTWGYVHAFREIMAQAGRAGITIDHIVSATGSGGTTAGLIAGRTLLGVRKPEIWGVNICDDAELFTIEIRGILEEMNSKYGLRLTEPRTPIRILDGYVGGGYAVPHPPAMEAIRHLGKLEGHLLDPVYTGKAFYGMTRELAKGTYGRKGTVLFIHTGGLFGLFPQRDAFGLPAGTGAGKAPASKR